MSHTIIHQDGFAISDDPVRFDVARAYQWIGVESYWSNGIPEETFRRAVANSLAVGVYAPDGAMVA
ncbi:MAG: GNAT family N-acetyltransferase, partial [Alphaproteobacteria bacterium]|nr:GNAT family N-acetyltransferase [Alphaproteobacteria bacterium]